jgi:hypothetical protein
MSNSTAGEGYSALIENLLSLLSRGISGPYAGAQVFPTAEIQDRAQNLLTLLS